MRRLASLGWLVMIGCGSPASPETPTSVALPTASAVAREPAVVAAPVQTIGVVAMPDRVAIDGALAEWGSSPSPATLWLAIDEKKLVVVIPKLPAGEPVFLALATIVPPVPEVGFVQRAASTLALDDEICAHERSVTEPFGKEQPPEVAAACRALIARRNKTVAAYSERFVRRLRITADAVTSIASDGGEVALAEVAQKARDETIELALPLGALPWLAEAPLSQLLGAVSRAPFEAAPPTVADAAGWTALTLPEPVDSAPHPRLREALFATLSSYANVQLAFDPKHPELIEVIHTPTIHEGGFQMSSPPQRPALVQDQHPLFTSIETIDDVTVGVVQAHDTFLATYEDGAFVQLEAFHEVAGVQQRNDELHVFAFVPEHNDWLNGGMTIPARWRAMAARKDGTLHEVADDGVDMVPMRAWDSPPKSFHDATFTRFGMRGIFRRRPKVVTWIWNPSAKEYQSQVVPSDQGANLTSGW